MFSRKLDIPILQYGFRNSGTEGDGKVYFDNESFYANQSFCAQTLQPYCKIIEDSNQSYVGKDAATGETISNSIHNQLIYIGDNFQPIENIESSASYLDLNSLPATSTFSIHSSIIFGLFAENPLADNPYPFLCKIHVQNISQNEDTLVYGENKFAYVLKEIVFKSEDIRTYKIANCAFKCAAFGLDLPPDKSEFDTKEDLIKSFFNKGSSYGLISRIDDDDETLGDALITINSDAISIMDDEQYSPFCNNMKSVSLDQELFLNLRKVENLTPPTLIL